MTETYADAGGAYQFTNLLPGAAGFIIRAYDPLYDATPVEKAGQFDTVGVTKTVDLLLPLVKGTVTAQVFAGDGATPLPGAYVQILATDFNALAGAYAGVDGRFVFVDTLLPVEGGLVRAYPSAYTSADQPFAAPATGGAVTVNVTVPGTLGSIGGIVTAGDGLTPLRNAEVDAIVQITDPQCSECGSTRTVGYAYTDAAGRFSFNNVLAPASGVLLRVWSPSYSVRVERTVLFPQQNTVLSNLVIALPVTTATGRVTFSNGEPVPNPTVFLTGTGSTPGTYYPSSTTTDGAYNFAELPAGTFQLTAQDAASGLTATASLTAAAEQAAHLDVTLPASNSITVRTLGDGDALLANVQVVLISEGLVFERYASTGADGTARFDRVPVGSFYLQSVWNDGTANRYVSASGTLARPGSAARGPPIRGRKHGDGDGHPRRRHAAHEYQRPPRRARVGRTAGQYRRTVTTDGAGVAVFGGVPLGILQVTASEANVYGIANGEATAPTLALPLVLGNGITLSTSLDGGDGFRYDVQSGGSLSDGGTVSRQVQRRRWHVRGAGKQRLVLRCQCRPWGTGRTAAGARTGPRRQPDDHPQDLRAVGRGLRALPGDCHESHRRGAEGAGACRRQSRERQQHVGLRPPGDHGQYLRGHVRELQRVVGSLPGARIRRRRCGGRSGVEPELHARERPAGTTSGRPRFRRTAR